MHFTLPLLSFLGAILFTAGRCFTIREALRAIGERSGRQRRFSAILRPTKQKEGFENAC